MGRIHGIAAMTLLVLLSLPASGVEVLDGAYRVEVYAKYVDQRLETTGFALAFDDYGNLYIPHVSGHVYRVYPNGTSDVVASVSGTLRDLVWTGGTGYGNNLYATNMTDNSVIKISPSGTVSQFSTIYSTPVALQLDTVGNFGGMLYAGMNVNDRVDYILFNGTRGVFSDFPYNNSGGVEGIAFAPANKYGGKMYLGIYSSNVNSYRGVYSMNTSGIATKFSNDLAWAQQIEFAPDEQFGGGMFVMGADALSGARDLWSMDEDGKATLFAKTDIWQLGGFCFGPDGAMYIAEFSYEDRSTTISRITQIPEPATFLLVSLGFALIRRRNRSE